MESHDSGTTTREKGLRTRAIKRIKLRRVFHSHVVVFLVVNAGLWIGWAVHGAEIDNLWPAWVTGIWLAILVLVAFMAHYPERPISDQQIEKEMHRLKDSSSSDLA